MKTGIRTRVYTSTMCILRLGLLSILAAAGPLLAQTAPANLVQIVRQATERFSDVNAATAAGYAPAYGCVTGPDMGAMGVHYINGALVV
jgi:hypothetical protein